MATQTTLSTVGIREDLTDAINLISARGTPFTSQAKGEKVTNTLHSWQIDSLAAINANNSVLEGSDATIDNPHGTVKVGNYVQTFRKTGQVSEQVQAVDIAGRGNELTFQKLRKGQEMTRDIEAIILSSQGSNGESGATTAKTAGALSWITTNATYGAGGAAGGFNANTNLVAAGSHGNAVTFASTQFEGALENLFVSTGENKDYTAYMSPAMKVAFSAFSGIALNRREISGKDQATIQGGVELYVSNFGSVTIVPHAYALTGGLGNETANSVLISSPEMWAVGTLRPITSQDLAKTGSSDKFMVETAKVLVCKNEKAHALITDIHA